MCIHIHVSVCVCVCVCVCVIFSSEKEENRAILPFAIYTSIDRPEGHSVLFSSVAQSCLTLCDPWTTAHQDSLSITNTLSLLKFTSIVLVMPSNHLIPFSSCLQSFPALGSFQKSQFFTSGGQNIGVSASASVLPMNIQD